MKKVEISTDYPRLWPELTQKATTGIKKESQYAIKDSIAEAQLEVKPKDAHYKARLVVTFEFTDNNLEELQNWLIQDVVPDVLTSGDPLKMDSTNYTVKPAYSLLKVL